jgi:CCR4-NOT transcription complex subunit 9
MDGRRKPSSSPARNQSPSAQSQASGGQASGFTNDQLVAQIKRIHRSDSERAQAIQTLWAARASIPDLALALWFSPATMTALLTDVLAFYPSLVAAKLDYSKMDNIFSILCLFQLIADHSDTRLPFVRANIPIYLFPILQYTLTNVEVERFPSVIIGIFVNLLKEPHAEVVDYFLKADFVPLCLRVLSLSKGPMRAGAAFIFGRIVAQPSGKKYLCDGQSSERAVAALKVLNQVLAELSRTFEADLSKYLGIAYQQLIAAPEMAQAIADCFTDEFKVIQPSSQCDDAFRALLGQLKNFTTRAGKR